MSSETGSAFNKQYHNCPFFFWLAFVLIPVILLLGFYTCPLDKASIQ